MKNETNLYSLLNEYVIDAIDGTSYGINIDKAGNIDKMKFFLDTYISEYVTPNTKRAIPSAIERIKSYLQGLPSCIGIEFRDYEIGLIGKALGVVTNDDERAEFICNWFGLVAKSIYDYVWRNDELSSYLTRI